MRKAFLLFTIIAIQISSLYSNELIDELMKRVNIKKAYMAPSDFDENKLYQLKELIPMPGQLMDIDEKENRLYFWYRGPMWMALAKWKIVKKDNVYTIEGNIVLDDKITSEKDKYEFTFFKDNFYELKISDNNGIYHDAYYYIDIKGDLLKRYEDQKKQYFYDKVKNLKTIGFSITKDNKILYDGETIDYSVDFLFSKRTRQILKNLFYIHVVRFPVEITGGEVRIIDKKVEYEEGIYLIDYDPAGDV